VEPQDSEVTDQHHAAFLEFDEDQDEKFSMPEVAELLLCMDKARVPRYAMHDRFFVHVAEVTRLQQTVNVFDID